MRKSHPVRRAVLAGAATVSGIVLLLSLKPASDRAPPRRRAALGAAGGRAVAAGRPGGAGGRHGHG